MSLHNDILDVSDYLHWRMTEGEQPEQDYEAAFDRILRSLDDYQLQVQKLTKENRVLRLAIQIVQQPKEKDKEQLDGE